jgi:hypothetical protein
MMFTITSSTRICSLHGLPAFNCLLYLYGVHWSKLDALYSCVTVCTLRIFGVQLSKRSWRHLVIG